MPLQGRYQDIANKMPNGARNVIGHMTTDLGPVWATHKKKLSVNDVKVSQKSFLLK